jgi:hypothetical protein
MEGRINERNYIYSICAKSGLAIVGNDAATNTT